MNMKIIVFILLIISLTSKSLKYQKNRLKYQKNRLKYQKNRLKHQKNKLKYQKNKLKYQKKHRKTPKGPKDLLTQNLPIYRFPFPTKYDANLDPKLVDFLVLDGQGNIHRNTVEKEVVNKPYKFCHIIDPEPFDICKNIKDCEICSRIPKCGWCRQSEKCVGAAENGPNCPDDCLSTFIFDWSRCGGLVKAGIMTNIATDATGVKQPEIVDNDNRVRVNTYQTKYAVREEKNQVGIIKRLNQIKAVNIDHQGQSEDSIKAQTLPLYGNTLVKIPVKDQLISSKVVNTETGKEYPLIPEPKVQHGIDSDNTIDPNSPAIQRPKKAKSDKAKSRLPQPEKDKLFVWGINMRKRKL